jgi:hypothetical protein
MAHPLDGARLKVIRAQEHLDSLKAEILMYLDGETNEVWSQPTAHPYPGQPVMHSLPSIIPGDPPLRLSTIIGDCVTNARAAVDYVMWELSQQYFSPPFDITKTGDRRITSFPIFQTSADPSFENRFNALANRKVPTTAISEIKSVQPYNAGYEPLRWLHHLVNNDKHRMPLLTVANFDNLIITISTPAIFQDLVSEPVALTIPRDDAAENGPPFQSNVQMKGEVALYVTWKDIAMPREPVDRTLEQIIKCVKEIIPRFDAFLT